MNFKNPGIVKICFALGLLLLAYVLLRAGISSYTHDEGLSYNLVKNKDYLAYTANNHLLNTWLMVIAARLFGETELSLRFFSVLLFAVYLMYGFKLLISAQKIQYVLFAVPFLFLNPFALDFFSMSRGYGLSMGFMMGSIYYFLRRTLTQNNALFVKDLSLSLLFACFALLSNLSLINFYISLLFLFACDYVFVFRRSLKKSDHLTCLLIFILACAPLAFSLNRLMVLKQANDLYVGAGSFDETISTFIERSCYSVPYPVWFAEFLQTFVKWILPLGLIVSLFKTPFKGPLFKLGALLLLMVLGFEAEHFLFNTLFPIGRTGVYFIPLLGLFIFYLFVQVAEQGKESFRKGFEIAGCVLLSLPLCIHFFYTMNLDHTFEWRYDTHTKEVVMQLKDKKKPLKLGHNWIFGPAINYYIQSRHLPIEAVKLEGNPYDQDFIYEFKDQLKDSTLILVKAFEDTQSAIYRVP